MASIVRATNTTTEASEDATVLTEQAKRRGRPPGSKNRPKDIATPEYEANEIGGAILPQRRRTRRSVERLSPKQVADLTLMAHELIATSFGPKAKITEEQAQALGEAIVPVLEDYGVRVASKVIHLVVLVTTVAMVEGPVVMGIAKDMRTQAQEERATARQRAIATLQPVPGAPNGAPSAKVWPPEPLYTEQVAAMSGIELGAPNIEPLVPGAG